MEKNFILTIGESHPVIESENTRNEEKKWAYKCMIPMERSRAFVRKIMMPVEWLGRYYSYVLGKPINRTQTLRLIETQVAFALCVLPTECPLLLRAAFLGWFAWGVWKCKKAGV